MAPSLRYVCVFVLVFFALSFKAISSTDPDPEPHQRPVHGIKSLHFTLFQHDYVNKTVYVIVNGVAGLNFSDTTSPFGTIIAFNDPLTVTANQSSKVVGIGEGFAITSSLDGLRAMSVAKVTLRLKQHKGSISVVGVSNNAKPSDHPVVGGTGDFLFVQGYVRVSPVNLKGLILTYKIEFHLYWPPFANCNFTSLIEA